MRRQQWLAQRCRQGNGHWWGPRMKGPRGDFRRCDRCGRVEDYHGPAEIVEMP